MNYRHAYHAGNFADCFKHALLIEVLASLAAKPAAYFVLDTHAGAGEYDLDGDPSRQTREADCGIRRLLHSASPALTRYLGLVTQFRLYPGSPTLIRGMMRPGDRLACCELHPDDVSDLRVHFLRDSQVEVHKRSGWEALGGLLPPREKRGLVFIDPPFEARDEFSTLLGGIRRGHERFRHGIFAAWYPIKQLAAVRDFHTGLVSSGIRDVMAIELHLHDAAVPNRLNGCGLVIINPPYEFECRARLVAEAVLDGIRGHETGAGTFVMTLAHE